MILRVQLYLIGAALKASAAGDKDLMFDYYRASRSLDALTQGVK